MSKTQWPHTLHLSPNPEKTICFSFQTGLFDLACNDYISKIGCSDPKIGCSGFY
jgi:hypothetical protein